MIGLLPAIILTVFRTLSGQLLPMECMSTSPIDVKHKDAVQERTISDGRSHQHM